MLSKYRLPNKIENEEIVKVIRKDFFILFTKILFFMFLFIVPIVFFAALTLIEEKVLFSETGTTLVVLLTSAYYLFIWLFFFFSFIDYYLDIWIITNERIIDIQQNGFFSRIISEQKLFRIQDVTSEVHGAIPTLLKYGSVHVQTAGAKERFFFEEVPNPDEIRNMIIQLVEENQKRNKSLIDEKIEEALK